MCPPPNAYLFYKLKYGFTAQICILQAEDTTSYKKSGVATTKDPGVAAAASGLSCHYWQHPV